MNGLAFDGQFSDPELLSNLHMIRFDVRGHGRSGMPEDPAAYESARFAEDYKTVADAYGLQKPIIVAWSAGASMIPDIIGAYGPIISGIIYVGGPILSFGLLFRAAHPHILSLAEHMMSPDYGEVYGIARAFVESCFADPSAIPFALKLQLIGSYTIQPPKVRVIFLQRQQDETRWREEGRQIPVRIVQGAEDLHNLHEKMVPLAREIYESVDVKLLEGVGHSPHVERTQEVNRYILEFVRKVVG